MNRNQEVSDCCQSCVSEDRSWILHNIRHRGIFRRFCTSCVLKFYSGSYCCVCYQVFDLSSLPNDRVFCLKCPSISHLNCVDKKDLYLCPPCANPAFQFFNTDKKKISDNSTSSKNRDEEVVVSENQGRRRIDGDLAKVLVAAAEIAAVSMSKAATATRLEAESRAKDAAFAKKRAKESVEFLKCATVSAKGKSCKEKDKEKVDSVKSSSLKEKHKKKCKTGGGVEGADTVEKHGSRVQFDAERNCKLGESKDLSDIFYSADKEREGSSGVIKANAVNNVCGKNGERLQLRKCVAMSGNTPSLISNSESHIVQEKNENNGVHSGLPDAEHPQHPPKSNHGVN